MQDTLEKTGESLTKQAQTIAKKQEKNPTENNDTNRAAATGTTSTDDQDNPNSGDEKVTDNQQQQQPDIGDRFKKGWGNMMQATKQAVQEARVAVEKEQHRIAARINHPDRPRRRDPALPLDVTALRDAEVVYITDRIMTLSHPAMQSTVDGDITPARKLAAIGQLLQKRHGGRYMVWNLSEVEYDVSILDDQVLLFSFPGSPSPPLGLLLKLLISMESWLKADERNVAVVHCLTGKGRTSTVVAAFLCWMGEAGFRDVHQALDYIAKCKRCPIDELTIPSQRRYIQYFANMLDGVRPSQPPLMLKRIILSEAPRFAKGPHRDNLPPPPDDSGEDYNPDNLLMGCAPYLQIFKAGQLVFTTAASLHYNQTKEELPFCQVADGTISFHVENVVQGDILLRCRHLTAQGQRVSMFRAAFHTGYVPPNVMRLKKAELDGACTDKRFQDDFFLDLIFEPCDAEMASKHLSGKADAEATAAEAMNAEESQNEASERRSRGTMAGSEVQGVQEVKKTTESQQATVIASAYDSMLHRDSRFWDVIAARRQEHAKQSQEEKDAEDIFWGVTVGRRREFDDKQEKTSEAGAATTESTTPTAHPTFSIGGGFDFMPSEEAAPAEEKAAEEVEEPKQRDELMEALMALDDEALSPDAAKRTKPVDTEEIHFNAPVELQQGTALFKEDEASTAKGSSEVNSASTTPPLEPAVVKTNAPAMSTAVDEVAAMLEDADLDLDDDVDAFLASAGADGGLDLDADVDDLDLDFDDEEFDDLENFLTSTK